MSLLSRIIAHQFYVQYYLENTTNNNLEINSEDILLEREECFKFYENLKQAFIQRRNLLKRF